ncbi:MAG: TetR/AcrR family transcriptional regulator [Candidatus Krumholzibacteriota bacterium]
MTEDRHTTKEKLLDAAECLFAEKGFENVSIRELAAAAEVNVAAVNYHFQGKENLFHEVIMRRFVAQRDRTLAALDGLLNATGGSPRLDQVIETLVRQYLEGSLAGPGSASFLSLMARQMQTGHSRMAGPFFREMVAPVFGAFSRAIRTARPGLEDDQVTWCISSIVGQIHHLILRWKKREDLESDPDSLQIMFRAFPPLKLSLPEYIDQVTEHITRFSTAAIDGLYPEVTK